MQNLCHRYICILVPVIYSIQHDRLSVWQILDLYLSMSNAVVDGLKYAKSHEWAKVEGGTATVGISDFAQVNIYATATIWPFVTKPSRAQSRSPNEGTNGLSVFTATLHVPRLYFENHIICSIILE